MFEFWKRLWESELTPAQTAARERVTNALRDYPSFNPPFREPRVYSAEFSKEDLKHYVQRRNENFDFFNSQINYRLQALSHFLEKFHVGCGLTQGELREVSVWCDEYIAFLATNIRSDDTREMLNYKAEWTGEWAGLNVIFDIGVLFGEAARKRNPKLYWFNMGAAGYDDGTVYAGSGFKIRGTTLNHFDPSFLVYIRCRSAQDYLRRSHRSPHRPKFNLDGMVRGYSEVRDCDL